MSASPNLRRALIQQEELSCLRSVRNNILNPCMRAEHMCGSIVYLLRYYREIAMQFTYRIH